MKSYLLVAPLVVLLLTNLFGEVKNGYERDMPSLRASLKCLRDMLDNEQHLSNAQKRNIKVRIRHLVDYLVYYEITDTLLRQFRTIAPELYDQMDTLKNSKGKIIDVYVKFIPKEGAQFPGAGMASFSPTYDDLNTCSSEYGPGSVSVKIWILNKALWVLSHEFGHLKYVVPNMMSYVDFYQKRYRTGPFEPTIGHRPDDPGGKSAMMFEDRFRESYVRYLRKDFGAIVSPMVLVNPIKKDLMQDLE